MNELFLKIVNTSISTSWLILAVLIVRLLLKKAPKWINVILWGIVAVKMVCPFSVESALSLIPSRETIPINIEMAKTPSINSGINVINSAVNPIISKSFTPAQDVSINPLQIWISIFSIIWIIGFCLLFIHTTISYIRLHKRIDTAVLYQDNIFQSENISCPFVLGIIKPKIYLPFHIEEQDLKYVVAHEQAHINRKDYLWKPIGFILMITHWFNPLMWLAYILLCRDIELACDEKVIKEMNNEQRANYTQALVGCSVGHHKITACPVAFGEIGVKERVKSIMNYKKPTFWIIIVSAIVCIIVSICFLTNPTKDKLLDETKLEQIKGIDDISYYLELASVGKEFQDMDNKSMDMFIKEYGQLLDGYSLLARKTTDGTASYILGTYDGKKENNPLYMIQSLDFSAPNTNQIVQILYYKTDYMAVEKALNEGKIPDMCHVIENSRIFYDFNNGIILIQPKNTKLALDIAFNKYLYTQNGKEYIKDAVSRGISMNTLDEPYIDIHLFSEQTGETSERIQLTEAQANAILAEKRQQITDGFAATLCIDGKTVPFSQMEGVPQSVLNLAIEKCNYKFITPSDIKGSILEARLDCDWLDAPLYANKNDLDRLKEMLINAKFGDVGSCGYAKLTLTITDGEKLTVFKATDGCDTMVFGSYSGYLIGDKENEEFWKIFGLDAETKQLLE